MTWWLRAADAVARLSAEGRRLDRRDAKNPRLCLRPQEIQQQPDREAPVTAGEWRAATDEDEN